MNRSCAAKMAVLTAMLCSAASAQFGGQPGDVVIYLATANGPGTLQALPGSTVNSAQANAAFSTVTLSTVPYSTSDPFPLLRQVLYTTQTETFQIGTDFENTVGLWRVFLYPTKIFQIQGTTKAVANKIGRDPAFINFPQGLDVVGDISLETLRVVNWFPGAWPFIQVTNQPGNVRPPNEDGYTYLFTTPGLVKLPSLMAWTPLPAAYPNAEWKERTFVKVMEVDAQAGDTIQLLRLQPGAQTPVFHLAGHTHVFVLQGSVDITPAGGSKVHMNTEDYVYLPEGFAISLSNPGQYQGPLTK